MSTQIQTSKSTIDLIYTSEVYEAMRSFQDEWLKRHNYTNAAPLYHYTTLDGLRGILKSRSIWCSHYSSFNDPLELQYGKGIVLTQLNNSVATEGNDDIKKLLRYIITTIEAFDKAQYHFFVACFSEAESLLSQWRGYSDDSGGYNLSISFDSETKFSHNIDKLTDESSLDLRKVIYEADLQKEIVEKCVTKIIEGAKSALKRLKEKGPLQQDNLPYPIDPVNTLFDIIFSIKHLGFHEEREWRLIKGISSYHTSELSLLKFRESRGGLIPYIHTYVYKNVGDSLEFPLKELRYGPMLEDLRTRASLDLLLHYNAAMSNPININPNMVPILGAGYSLR